MNGNMDGLDTDSTALPPLSDRSSAAALARRVEEASLNAWPALQQLLYDGWLLRFAGGFTKRANAIVPLYPGALPVAEKMAFCDALYRRAHLKTIVRLASVHPLGNLDDHLASDGYERIDPTEVLAATVDARDRRADDFVETSPDEWLTIYGRLANMPAEAGMLHGALLKGIRLPCVFGAIVDHGEPLACGLAVVEQDLVGLFDIVTHRQQRRRGYGRRLVSSLMCCGERLGAATAYLQVLADNAPALALYERLGFAPLYRYWYRVSEVPVRYHPSGATGESSRS